MERRDQTAVNELTESFYSALLLTGNVEGAEAAVLEAIAALDSDLARLPEESAKAAIQRNGKSQDYCGVPEALPAELRRLFHLAPVSRACFVLRVLMNLSPATCCRVLQLSKEEFHDSLCSALRGLHDRV